MGLFKKRIESIDDVRQQIWALSERERRHLLPRNPYLGNFVTESSVLFVPERTLTREDRRIRGEFAGAVILNKTLPDTESSYAIPVALATGATHDHRSYKATVVEADELPEQILQQGDRHAIAKEAASLAVHGYLMGERATSTLFAAERRQPVIDVLWENRSR